MLNFFDIIGVYTVITFAMINCKTKILSISQGIVKVIFLHFKSKWFYFGFEEHLFLYLFQIYVLNITSDFIQNICNIFIRNRVCVFKSNKIIIGKTLSNF